MSLQRLTIDRDTLPTDMLDLAKQHMRVDFTDDDAVIQMELAQAIDTIERLTEFNINAASWAWRPGPTDSVNMPPLAVNTRTPGWQVPVFPVRTLTVVDAAGVDITTQFAITGTMSADVFTQQWVYSTGDTNVIDGVFTLDTGYALMSDLPPSLLGLILRYAAFLYANREQDMIPGFSNVDYANELITGLWGPRC